MAFSLVPVKLREIEMLLDLAGQYYAFDHIKFSRQSSKVALMKLVTDKKLGSAFFLKSGRETIGYCMVTYGFDHEFGGKVAWITDFFIIETHRRKGFGALALKEIEKRCLKAGVLAIELQVTSKNKAARSLYEKMGFSAFERVPMAKFLKKGSRKGG